MRSARDSGQDPGQLPLPDPARSLSIPSVRIRRALVPVLLVAPAVLMACGGDDSGGDDADDAPTASSSETTQLSSEAGDEVAACDLLTTEEVEAAVGTPVKEGVPRSGEPITGGTYTSCLWMSDDPSNPADQAQLYLYSNTEAADSAREDDSQEISGIGDSAFTVTFAGVWVYQGEQSFLAQWYTISGTDEENLPKSEALAKAASAKL